MADTYSIGKVAMTFKGAYDANASYEKLDVVTHNGTSYGVLQACTGVTPPNATYYQVLAQKGNNGQNGSAATIAAGTVTMLPVGSSPTVTNSGTSNSAIFNFGIPTFDTSIIASDFNAANQYFVGDYCVYNEILYRFIAEKSAGVWDSTKVVAVALADDVSDLKSALDLAKVPLYDDKNRPFTDFSIGSFASTGNIENATRVRSNKQEYLQYDLVYFTWDSALEVRIAAWHPEIIDGTTTWVWDDWQNSWGDASFSTTGGRRYRALIRYKNDTSHIMTDADVTFIQSHIYVTAKVASYKAPDAELSAEIEKVKENLTNGLIALSNTYNYTSDGGFSVYEIGSFDGISDVTNNRRIRTNYQFIDTDVVRITFDSSLEVRIGCFTNGTPKLYEGMANNWGETVIVINGGRNIRALIRYRDDINHVMTDEDVAFVESHVYVEAGTNEYNVYEEEVAYSFGLRRKALSWRTGSISVTTGQNDNSTIKRIRSSVFIQLDQLKGSVSLVTDDQNLQARVLVYGEENNSSYEMCMSGWTNASPVLPIGKYLRVVIRYSDNRDISDSMIDAMVAAFRFQVSFDVHEEQYKWLQGKTVAILGDSISTTGTRYIDEESQVPEIIVTADDVGQELKAVLTYRDFHPYSANSELVEPFVIGGQSYYYSDAIVGTEITFTPTADDIGKWVGAADNHNPAGMKVWWQYARDELGFIPLNASFSGSCISRARDHNTSYPGWVYYQGAYAWHISQIRRCGRRIPGTMDRVSPDVIIIYRGTNDFGSFRNGKYPTIDMSLFEGVKNIQNILATNKDLVGNAPARNPSETDMDLYGFVQAYTLTILRLQQAYPFAMIFLCTIQDIWRADKSGTFPNRNNDNTLIEWNNAIRAIAENTGCGIIDLARDGTNFFNYSTFITDDTRDTSKDWVHPGQYGQYIMGLKAVADLKAQYNPMIDRSIQDIMNDDSIIPYDYNGDTSVPPLYGPGEGILEQIKFRSVWDGETTIG